MKDVLRYFTEEGRSVGRFFDSGLNELLVGQLLANNGTAKAEVSEYLALYRTLKELEIEVRAANDGSRVARIDKGGEALIVPVSPDEAVIRKATEDRLSGITGSLSVNGLSTVMAIQVGEDGSEFCALLTGDADTPDVDQSLRKLATHNGGSKCQFLVVKIPHHGSFKGHTKDLCNSRKQKGSVAMLSIGNKHKLPKRIVLAEYLDAGWVVASTRKRPKAPVADVPGLVSGSEDKASASLPVLSDVLVEWRRGASVEVEPDLAVLTHADCARFYS